MTAPTPEAWFLIAVWSSLGIAWALTAVTIAVQRRAVVRGGKRLARWSR